MEDYVQKFDDFEVLCEGAKKLLVCKGCRLSISDDPHHISSRLNEHLKSSRHLQLKNPRTEPEEFWTDRTFLNVTISPCKETSPCIHGKNTAYTITFYANASYADEIRPWWIRNLNISHVDQGKLDGSLLIKQSTEDGKWLMYSIPINFTHPQVNIPMRVTKGQIFKGTVTICPGTFHADTLDMELDVGSTPYYFACCKAQIHFQREWKKCLNYDDPRGDSTPPARSEL
uniref:Putative ml domain protein n=1 Tax=Ixodes ricinus TaxID=34613 RepID=A0A6B0V636_IXORI